MDFKKSLNDGLEAAKIARKNKQEILSVVEELSATIEDFSGGLVTLAITKEQKVNKSSNPFLGGIASAMNINPFINYNALSLILQTDKLNRKEIIAEWRINESDGYPCVISYNGDDISCRTKETLEKALSSLISNASTGERLLQLVADGQQE
ncbi:TPA: hypothetical protein OW286_002184 [Citrobacter freundii]|nr:hypothetical protein [Citrobacter freundii]